MKEHYIGLMSGTSADAIDAALVTLTDHSIELTAHYQHPIPTDIRQAILAFNTPGNNEIQRLGELDTYLGEMFADTCLQLLANSSISPQHIHAIGSHGQTIRHAPTAQYPFTLQIGDPNIIACRTNITTVADFRRRDIALGGQGAPLTPAFHAFLFRHQPYCWVLNIGGIANVTYLTPHSSAIMGFDTGPGNCLMDAWCQHYQQHAYDHNGAWAKQGKVQKTLLQALLNDDYFCKVPPKSTGRDYFNLAWLQRYLRAFSVDFEPVDVQATLLELTVQGIYHAIQSLPLNQSFPQTNTKPIWVCGGGSHNAVLMQRLREAGADWHVQTTEACGIPAQWIEASAFAWFAQQTLHHRPSNIPSVTGAKRASILGAIYPTNT